MPCRERRAGLRGAPAGGRRCAFSDDRKQREEKVVPGNPGCERHREKDPVLEKAKKSPKEGRMEQNRPKVTADIKSKSFKKNFF